MIDEFSAINTILIDDNEAIIIIINVEICPSIDSSGIENISI